MPFPVRFEQRKSAATGWCRAFACFAAVLAMLAALAHRFGLLETIDFLNVLPLVVVLAVLALAFGAFGFRRVWVYGDRSASELVFGIALAVLVLLPLAFAAYQGLTQPALYDVSTDTIDPPRFERAAALRSLGMNPVRPISRRAAELQAAAYPEVAGRRYAIPAERVRAAVLSLIERHGWTLLADPGELDSPEVTIEALAHTFWLGFPCDVGIRITDEGNTTFVDMRSASRFGARDLGDNAARVVEFLAALDAEMTAQAGTAPAETGEGG